MQTIQVALTFPALGIQKATPSINTDALVAGVSLLAQVKGPSLATKKERKKKRKSFQPRQRGCVEERVGEEGKEGDTQRQRRGEKKK